jgi:hypothetical protein
MLFGHLRHTEPLPTASLVTVIAPLACDIVSRGDGFDLSDLDDIPFQLLPAGQLAAFVDALVARIEGGLMVPDEYTIFAESISKLVEALTVCATSSQAERLYSAVQPAAWIHNREERCAQLLARLRIEGEK